MCVYIGPKTILSNLLKENRTVTYAQAYEYTIRLREALKKESIYPYIILNRDEIEEVLSRTDSMREFDGTVFAFDKIQIKAIAEEMNDDYDEKVRSAIVSCVEGV